MGKRLFVGNLSFETTGDELRELFASAGTVQSASVMTDRATGRSRGFGFVEMGTDDEAQKAIAELNGREFHGRGLNVNEARERTGGGGGGFSRGGPPREDSGFGGFGGYGGGFGGGDRGPGHGPPPKPRKEGGSRRGLRARKRSL